MKSIPDKQKTLKEIHWFDSLLHFLKCEIQLIQFVLGIIEDAKKVTI